MRLCINIDHVATLRQARREEEPDPVLAAGICELAGADGIVCHLREDRRHIIDRDVRLLKETVKTKLDLEMAATDEMVKIACEIKPYMVTLVPEKRQELTTEGGLDLHAMEMKVSSAIDKLKAEGIKVSVFIEPQPESIDMALEVGSDMIEIHTGKYALIEVYDERILELDKISQTAKIAKELGLGVNAGHGLNYLNIITIANMLDIDEVSIGHSIIARAVFTGLHTAVKEMVEIIRRARQ
ncbi:MAG: pyridoxine 5'-phosphate synthase [Chlorobi bacterium]|nr:pyridoxine 5'-phosphate synthase [Chlorobiota bacterium]MCI0715004.1 pyridoxine 5'-phosphate synthase [Chlorobiota bacterium]